MKRLGKLLFALLTFWFLIFLFPDPGFASEEFETNYQVEYRADFQGKTHVYQKISLTNKMSNVYASQYAIIIHSAQVQNIEAKDSQGNLPTEIQQQEGQTRATFSFNEQVVGKGKSLNFTIDYDVFDLIQKNGQIWEISLPKLGEAEKVDNYILKLFAPLDFGQLSFVTPNPVLTTRVENSWLLQFGKEEISRSGVRVVFGDYQVFEFSLKYHLENPNRSSAWTEIALPPETAFQQVNYQEINPQPINIEIDPDGNWLAQYLLKPKEKLNVLAQGKARLLSEPRENFPPPSQANLTNNLRPQKYWPVDNPEIQKKAQELKDPRKINRYVVNALNYDISRITQELHRFGALGALQNPNQAICMEFTDLFITLARAADVPAREINGYAYTTNEKLRPLSLMADVLHAWPEYWNGENWIPLDPTWENTTGGINHFGRADLNHFAFTIHGEKSEYPPPAGAYKAGESSGKDVEVKFSDSPEFETETNFEVEFNFPPQLLAGFNQQGSLVIKNLGPSTGYYLQVKISAEGLKFLDGETQKEVLSQSIPIFPPFSQQEISLNFVPQKFFKPDEERVSVKINGQEFEHKIKVSSIFKELMFPLMASGISLLFWWLLKKKLRRVSEAL